MPWPRKTGFDLENNILFNYPAAQIEFTTPSGSQTSTHNMEYRDDGVALQTDTSYSAFIGNDYWGTNPMFMAPYASPINDQLKSTSFAIDHGTTQSSVTSDLLSLARPQGSAYDIGAYEFVATDPAITVQPTDQTVTSPATATFSITATGTATVTCQWYKNGVLIAGATSFTYTTPATTTGDNGALFHGIVSGPGPNSPITSIDATLHVNSPLITGGPPYQKTYGRGAHGNGTR